MKDYTSAFWAGDIHIKDDSNYPVVSQFCNIVNLEEPKLLGLGGDIFDPWVTPWEHIIKLESTQRLLRTVYDVQDKGNDVIWIPRNHDYHPPKIDPFNYIEQRPNYQFSICGQPYIAMHGHEFDVSWGGIGRIPGIAPFAFWLACHAPFLMIPLQRKLFGSTPSMEKAQVVNAPAVSVPKMHPTMQEWTMHTEVINLRARKLAYDKKIPILFFHTHRAVPWDGLVINPGDLINDHQFIEIDADGPRIAQYEV